MKISCQAKVEFDNVPRLRESLRSEAGDIVQEIARDLAAEATRRAPVLTGALAQSIDWERTGPMSAIVEAGDEAAAHVEYGTTRQEEQHYLMDQLDEWRRRLEERLGAVIERAGRG